MKSASIYTKHKDSRVSSFRSIESPSIRIIKAPNVNANLRSKRSNHIHLKLGSK